MTDMTIDPTRPDPLTVAEQMLDRIVCADHAVTLEDTDRGALHTADGLQVDHLGHTYTVWLRDDIITDTVVVWSGNDTDPDMTHIVELEIRSESDRDLCDYRTGDRIRAATYTEWSWSILAANEDGGAGVVDDNGWKWFVR
jgi:hypothetical protein